MRKFIESFNRTEVDLDNPETYSHLPNTINELNDRMLREIGFTTCYMDYWHPDIFDKEKQKPIEREWTEEEIAKDYPNKMANSGYDQRQRVYKLIEGFTKNRHDNWKNIMWFKEQVYLMEDEIENMC